MNSANILCEGFDGRLHFFSKTWRLQSGILKGILNERRKLNFSIENLTSRTKKFIFYSDFYENFENRHSLAERYCVTRF